MAKRTWTKMSVYSKEGTLFLSTIRDLYDNSIVTSKTATQQTIHFYNHERIQTKTGVAPLTLRHSV